MSALAQISELAEQRKWSEAEALCEIGSGNFFWGNFKETLEYVLRSAARITGVTRIVTEPLTDCEALRRDFRTGIFGPAGLYAVASAKADIAACGQTWGTIYVYFSLRENGLESPLRFARFLGQQIAAALNYSEQRRQRDAARRSLAALERRLATYKSVQRAKGLVAQKHRLSQENALRSIFFYARKARRSLLQVSEAIIFLER